MKSDIQKELEANYKEMEELLSKQLFSVKDANRFLERYYNVIRKMEDLEKSRNLWRMKYDKLKLKIMDKKNGT